MSLQFRAINSDELDNFYRTLSVPFGFDPSPEMIERFKKVIEPDRLRAACDDDQLVATFGAYSLQLTVPGGALPTAGTTLVTVLPTHRRQGILRTLMAEHLEEVHQRSEPLAALWASESSIYGRFGYGPAAELVEMKLEKPHAVLRQPIETTGTIRLVDCDEALNVFPLVFNRVLSKRPGMYARTDNWWKNRFLNDVEQVRHGATEHRRAIHVRDGEPVGYVLYRTKTDFPDGKHGVRIIELIGVDADAEKALWQFIFGIDLIAEISYWNQPVDDPLRWWLTDPRRMERKPSDSLWVRLIDVVAALNGRKYSSAGSVVFRMRDEFCPWNEGVYSLEVDNNGIGQCESSNGDAAIELTPFALGAAYLGGTRFRDLARAGLMTGNTEAVKQLDAMFAWDPPPWCQEVF